MPTNRNLVFADDEIYHVFNRGIERRPTFTTKTEFNRAMLALDLYRFSDLPIRLSKILTLPLDEREQVIRNIRKESGKVVEIICFCLMPNHFHFLLRQKLETGISTFAANFTNSYTKYFNAKHERVGPLFQGLFKAVHIQSDEQLVHVSRYIHLNPVSSYLIEADELESYKWSSYPEYIGKASTNIADKEIVLNMFDSKEKYKEFVLAQVDYARELERIKHLILE